VDLLADENAQRDLIDRLAADGHRIDSIRRDAPGIPDSQVLERGRLAASLVLTSDLDFGDLVFRLRRSTAGVVLIRLHGMTPLERADRVSDVLREFGDTLVGRFTVISANGVRVRDTP